MTIWMWKSRIAEVAKGLPPELPIGKLLSSKFTLELQSLDELFDNSLDFPQIFFTFDDIEVSCFGTAIEYDTDKKDTISDQIKTCISNYEISGLLHRPIIIGGQAFDETPHTIGTYWANVPRSLYVLPEVQIVKSNDLSYLIVNIFLKEKISRAKIIFKLESIITSLVSLGNSKKTFTNDETIIAHELDLGKPRWERMLNEVYDLFGNQSMQKIVLSRYLRKTYTKSTTELVKSLRAQHKNCFRFLIRFNRTHAFISATPELLFEINNRQFHTMALAGTIKRELVNSINEQMKTQLLWDKKELNEHQIVVENIVKQLIGYVENLEYPTSPNIKELSTIQHLETPIKGYVRGDKDPFDMLTVLHPTPAVGGQPKSHALHHLRVIEPHDRGWYAGTFGILSSNEHAIVVVSIRSALLIGNTAILYAGAGIVPGSTVKNEWDETESKFHAISSILDAD